MNESSDPPNLIYIYRKRFNEWESSSDRQANPEPNIPHLETPGDKPYQRFPFPQQALYLLLLSCRVDFALFFQMW